VPVQYTASSEVTRADDGAQLAWGADGSLTTRTLGSDVTTYASDALGRRTSTTTASGDVASFDWDQVGRMTGLSDTATGTQTDYTYSGGLRVGAATTVGAGTPDEVTSTESFTWDTLAGVPLLLSDGGYEYIYGLGSSPVAQVDTATGDVTFLHGDLVGSTRTATDASGTVVGTWDYTPFGETTTATGGAADDGAGVTRFLFAGEYQDDSGLTYLRARFYDPVTASFLSVDPALAQTGSPYAYASGNPLQLVDPLGLLSLPNPFADATNFLNDTVKHLSRGGSVSDMLGELGCRMSGGYFDSRALGGFVDVVWDRGSKTARFVSNAANPLTSLAAGIATFDAVATGASCEFDTGEMLIVCYGAGAGYLPNGGGTMWGTTYVSKFSKATMAELDAGGRQTLAHEGRHSTLQAFIGVTGIGVLEAAAGGVSALEGEITGDSHPFSCNLVEWMADYTDGGYEQCSE